MGNARGMQLGEKVKDKKERWVWNKTIKAKGGNETTTRGNISFDWGDISM